MFSSSASDSATIGPEPAPCIRRAITSIGMLVASPHSIDIATNSNTEMQNVRTSPKRRAIQPVNGCMIALASEYELIAQVPSFGLTPRLPAICGTETLTMVRSSTSMKVENATATVSNASGAPCSGGARRMGSDRLGSGTLMAQRSRLDWMMASAAASAFAGSSV